MCVALHLKQLLNHYMSAMITSNSAKNCWHFLFYNDLIQTEFYYVFKYNVIGLGRRQRPYKPSCNYVALSNFFFYSDVFGIAPPPPQKNRRATLLQLLWPWPQSDIKKKTWVKSCTQGISLLVTLIFCIWPWK